MSSDNVSLTANDIPCCSEDDVQFVKTAFSSHTEITEISDLAKLLKVSLSSTLECQKTVTLLTEENTNVKRRMSDMEANFTQLDQYSRKDVTILTGLPVGLNETQEDVEHNVLDILHHVRPDLNLTMKDFSAIHRNGKSGKNGKPPSITIKFLRLHEKEKFMSKDAKTKFKQKHVNVFHALCPGMINQQSLISEHPKVDYVFYAGPRGHFTAKLKCNDLIKYVKNLNDFNIKCDQHRCPKWSDRTG